MAKQTYAQLQQQIAVLNKQAEQLRRDEIGEVVAKIRDAIKAYDISSADLYGTAAGASGAKSKSTAKSKLKSKSKSKSADKSAKFADGQGGEWVGRGPRPKWLRDALANGRRLEEFATDGGASRPAAEQSPAAAPASAKKKAKAKDKRAASQKSSAAKKVTFSDGAGNQWSGRGPQPGWLKAGIASGRSIDEFRV
jgi:DNA-binding protein H-NS